MERIENRLEQVSGQKERRQAAARLAAARQRNAERNAALMTKVLVFYL